MQIVTRGIPIEVDVAGPSDGKALLLIMGLGMQMTAWDDAFVAGLVDRGFRVIRFDNRDSGLSRQHDEAGAPALARVFTRLTLRLPVETPYRLADLADDAAGVLEALGVPSAHVCGASMGGMIAQHLALRHPAKVRSLTLMMTSSGARHLPGPSLGLRLAMMGRSPGGADPEALVTYRAAFFRRIQSPGYPLDEMTLRERLRADAARAYRPVGTTRQLVAVAVDGDRSDWLTTLNVPCEIIHGLADPLVPPAAGEDLHAKIAGSALDLIPGMGHDLPPALYPRFTAAIERAASRSR